MTDTSLKSVFTLDPETQVYKLVAHNLSASEAVERSNSEPAAKIADQTERHRTSDPQKCKACKKAAEELTATHAEAASTGVEEEAVQESEVD